MRTSQRLTSQGSFNSSFSLTTFLFTFLMQTIIGDIEQAMATLSNTIIMARKGFGGHGSGLGGAQGHAKGLLVVIVLILLIPAVALTFTGGTTGSTGVYTNATVANNARNGTVQFSQFIGIAMILGVIGVVISLV